MSTRLYAVLIGAAACLLLVIGAALRPVFDAPAPAPTALSVAEIGFSQDMAVHHAQALSITQSLSATASPEVLTLAHRIEASQNIEIGILHGWLMLVDQPLASEHPMQWMPDSEHHSHSNSTVSDAPMPGLASWTEIDELSTLTGTAADIRFLQLMIRHHQGGIDMATAGAEMASSGALARAARSMVDEQTQDLGYMTLLLQQRSAPALPYP
nr:DUF305 domain-containing protein [Rhodococcus sp. (in: high G+C Gram-positive bacteria)]